MAEQFINFFITQMGESLNAKWLHLPIRGEHTRKCWPHFEGFYYVNTAKNVLLNGNEKFINFFITQMGETLNAKGLHPPD